MRFEPLTIKDLRARPVVLKLQRPVVARIATITDWPLILIDLYTEEGVIGRSYLEPYIIRSMGYLLPALADLADLLKGQKVAPVEVYDIARKSLHFVGYQGLSMIAVSGCWMRSTVIGSSRVSAAIVTRLGSCPVSSSTCRIVRTKIATGNVVLGCGFTMTGFPVARFAMMAG